MSVTLYKVGGSLLDVPDLAARLRRIISADVSPLIIVGGGPTANLVREWDRIHQLGEERAHWLALRSLRLNESLLAELLPDAKIVRTRDEASECWGRGGWPILSAYDFVVTEEPTATVALPHTWAATSDSVAAWVARCWPVERMVLLKSVELPLGATNGRGFTIDDAREMVDPRFETLAREIPSVEWINLRGAEMRPQRLIGPYPSPHETA